MTARRIVAVLAAVVLIGGALFVRRALIDDDGTVATADPPAVTATTVADAAAIVCSTELSAACDAIRAAHPELTVDVEPAGTTLDRLATLPDGSAPPVWLTVAPFPAMADSLRTGLEPLGGTAEVLAASQLIVATPIGRAAVLESGCGGAPLWRCVGDHASSPWTDIGGDASWGALRPSLGLVEREAVALASFATAVAGYLGTPSITRSAWEADAAFIPWLRRLAGAVSESALSLGTPLATMATRPAVDIAATTTAELGVLAQPDRFEPSYPEPSMWVEAVLAVPEGVAVPDDVAAIARTALEDAGWDGAATATQSLPNAPTMIALRELWKDAT